MLSFNVYMHVHFLKKRDKEAVVLDILYIL